MRIIVAALMLSSTPGDLAVARAVGQLTDAGKGLRDAVVWCLPERVLAFIGGNGIDCIDEVVARRTVERDLRNEASWLHAYLFDEDAFKKRFGDDQGVSLAGFFRKHRDARAVVRLDGSASTP